MRQDPIVSLACHQMSSGSKPSAHSYSYPCIMREPIVILIPPRLYLPTLFSSFSGLLASKNRAYEVKRSGLI